MSHQNIQNTKNNLQQKWQRKYIQSISQNAKRCKDPYTSNFEILARRIKADNNKYRLGTLVMKFFSTKFNLAEWQKIFSCVDDHFFQEVQQQKKGRSADNIIYCRLFKEFFNIIRERDMTNKSDISQVIVNYLNKEVDQFIQKANDFRNGTETQVIQDLSPKIIEEIVIDNESKSMSETHNQQQETLENILDQGNRGKEIKYYYFAYHDEEGGVQLIDLSNDSMQDKIEYENYQSYINFNSSLYNQDNYTEQMLPQENITSEQSPFDLQQQQQQQLVSQYEEEQNSEQQQQLLFIEDSMENLPQAKRLLNQNNQLDYKGFFQDCPPQYYTSSTCNTIWDTTAHTQVSIFQDNYDPDNIDVDNYLNN